MCGVSDEHIKWKQTDMLQTEAGALHKTPFGLKGKEFKKCKKLKPKKPQSRRNMCLHAPH